MEEKKLDLEIVPGMANKEKIIYERLGEQVPDMLQGDIILQLKQAPHSVFKRVQNNLYMNVDISLQQSLFGYSGSFTHLDGHKFEIASTFGKVIQPFSWIIVQGEGMPVKHRDGRFGDLHAKMMV